MQSRDMATILEEGKRQYNLIQAKTRMPALGDCWKNAIAHLHQGCNHLNDQVQSEVALRLANCFLEGAGHATHDCDAGPLTDRERCLKSMPDRAFNAYTEFYTHAQSMCFFIMSQVWHEETEKTIDKLSTSAADVARQLEASEELQEELLHHQRQSVTMQQELLSKGQTLGLMLHESRDSLNLIFHEFRSSTIEQQRLLSLVFHHLSALQTWIVGEISWVDSIAFYIPTFALSFFLTSAHCTSSARIPVFMVLITCGLIERLVAHILLQADHSPGTFQPVDVINEQLNWWVWFIRRMAVVIIIGIIIFLLYTYKDQEKLRHQLLLQIHKQNSELLEYIRQERSPDKNRPQTVVGGLRSRSDETDSFGYIAVPATPERDSFTATEHELSDKKLLRPIPIRSLGAPLNRSNDSELSGIASLHSPFKPIREVMGDNSTTVNATLSPLRSDVQFTNLTSTSQSLEGNDFTQSLDTSPLTSTPKQKTKGRKQIVSASSVSSATRYNLRQTRTPLESV